MRVLVTGANGQLGSEIVASLQLRAERSTKGPRLDVVGASHERLDVAKRDEVLAAVTSLEPDIVFHSAAWTAVDLCESDPDKAMAVNALGTRHIAEAARLVGAHVVYVSTDYVFDGRAEDAYREWDTPNPLSVYGRSKLAGELAVDSDATIVRTSWVCGRVGANMVKTILRLMQASDGPLRFVNDQRGSPSIANEIAPVLVELGLSRRRGIFHLTNQGATTWFDFARAVVEYAGGDHGRVEPIATIDLDPPRPAHRPANSVLDNAALRLGGDRLPSEWTIATEALVHELVR